MGIACLTGFRHEIKNPLNMKLSDLTRSGHWPTFLAAFLYFDYSFMVCTFIGALLRPVGGAAADKIGGVRSLYRFYVAAGLALIAAALVHKLAITLALFVAASGSLGMANGAVFRLLPQCFRRATSNSTSN
jgi:MFS-type transporter involved in bile tolerance (Atg22 family)